MNEPKYIASAFGLNQRVGSNHDSQLYGNIQNIHLAMQMLLRLVLLSVLILFVPDIVAGQSLNVQVGVLNNRPLIRSTTSLYNGRASHTTYFVRSNFGAGANIEYNHAVKDRWEVGIGFGYSMRGFTFVKGREGFQYGERIEVDYYDSRVYGNYKWFQKGPLKISSTLGPYISTTNSMNAFTISESGLYFERDVEPKIGNGVDDTVTPIDYGVIYGMVLAYGNFRLGLQHQLGFKDFVGVWSIEYGYNGSDACCFDRRTDFTSFTNSYRLFLGYSFEL